MSIRIFANGSHRDSLGNSSMFGLDVFLRPSLFLILVLLFSVSSFLYADEKTFRFVHEKEPSVYDPQVCSEAECLTPLFHATSALYTVDEKNQLVLGDAVQHVVLDEGKIHLFEIRPIQWHDGVELTAQHYVAAFQRLANPKTASSMSFLIQKLGLENAHQVLNGHMAPSLLGVKALSKKVLMLKLDRPCAQLKAILSLIHFSPYRPDQKKLLAKDSEYPFQFIGTGPYKLIVHHPGRGIYDLVRSASFRSYQIGSLSKIQSLGVSSDPISNFHRFQIGEIDLVNLRTENINQALDTKLQIQVAPSGLYHLELNQRPKAVFSDIHLRKILYYGLNRDHLVNKVIGLQGFQVLYGFIPHYVHNPAGGGLFRSKITRQYNPRQAQKWLHEYKKNHRPLPPLRFLCSGQGYLKSQCDYLQQHIGQLLGTQIVQEEVPFAIRRARLKSGDYDIALIAWVPDYNAPDNFLGIYHSRAPSNYAGYQSSAYDHLLEQAEKQGESNPDIYHQLEHKLILEDFVTIPCYDGASLFTINPSFKGVIRRNIGTEFDFRFVSLSVASTMSKNP